MVSCFLDCLGLRDTCALRRDVANQALNFTLHKSSNKSDKINKQDWNWNIAALLSIMHLVFILDFHQRNFMQHFAAQIARLSSSSVPKDTT